MSDIDVSLIVAHLDNAQHELDQAKSEPCHSTVEDRLIDALDFIIGALREHIGEAQ